MYCFLKDPKPKVAHPPSHNIYIEPTNACNLRCIVCARAKMKRKTGFLKLSDFEQIIDKFVENNWYPPITVTGNGEPMLHKDIFSMIKYAKKKEFNVSLVTNSTLLDKKRAKLLIQSGLDRYQTMLDSIDKESYERLRVGANYERTKKNIINLIEMNEQMGHPIFLSLGLVDTSLTKKIEETKNFWWSFPIDNFYHSPLLSLQADSGLYSEAIKIANGKQRGICTDPFIAMSIKYNGDVCLCALDFNNRWVVGNIFKDTLEEIWNGEKAQKIRQAMIDNDVNFFKSVKHHCEICNVPYIEENTINGYRKSIPSRMARKIMSFHAIVKDGKNQD